MGIYRSKGWWHRQLDGSVRRLVAWEVEPDWFTSGAIVLGALAGAAFLAAPDRPGLLWAVPPLLALRLGFNLLDGQIARGRGLADPWGEAKNELGDRAADSAIFAGLALSGLASATLGWLTLVLALLVAYCGLMARAITGTRSYAGPMGKGDRSALVALGALAVALGAPTGTLDLALVAVILGSVITLLVRCGGLYVACRRDG